MDLDVLTSPSSDRHVKLLYMDMTDERRAGLEAEIEVFLFTSSDCAGNSIGQGLSDEIGTLESGKLADIVIIDGDPLADVYQLLNVKVVIKGGEIVVDNR